jgi:uncharacterized protein (TIGR03435 family)
VDTDRYDIVATAPADAGLDEMYGPMMRALLEDRFSLRVHTEIRELPVYTLSVGKGGSRLTAAKEGGCVPIDLKTVLKSPPPQSNYCGRIAIAGGVSRVVDGYGTTISELINRVFKDALDRPVLDQTGLIGRFNIHLEYVVGDALPGTLSLGEGNSSTKPVPVTDGPSIFTAVREQLGLALTPGKGPVEVIVIDHVAKPSAN